MAGGRRAPVKSGRAAAEPAARRPPLLYTAQDVARFCEVDLKTVHHWADRGKVLHHRTEGRHLRFRRNDVVTFLRGLGYPIPAQLAAVRPLVAIAPPAAPEPLADLTKRLASRFDVRRHPNGVIAIAHVVADAPDALVLFAPDASLSIPHAVAALKAAPETSWVAIAVVAHGAEALPAAQAAGAEVTLRVEDVAKLPAELARALAIA
jgi:excisionase family DNA binding protein